MVISSSNVVFSSLSTPPIGSRSSSSAGETDGGGFPIQASSGGGDDVFDNWKRDRSGTRVSVDSRARVYMVSISSVGRQIRGTPCSS